MFRSGANAQSLILWSLKLVSPNTAFANIENRFIRQSLISRFADVTCAENSSLK